MKEIKYKGNFIDDVRDVNDNFDLRNKHDLGFAIGVLGMSLIVIFCWLLTKGLPLENFLTWFLGFAIFQVTTLSLYIKKIQKNSKKAAERLKDLNFQLEQNNCLVNDSKLLSIVRKKENDIEEVNQQKVTKINSWDKLIMYWAFLDKKEQVQVLKYMRNNVTEEMFYLLEEEDKRNLDTSLKKVLKIDK